MGEINWPAVMVAIALINLIGGVLLAALLWRARGEFATKAELAKASERLDRHNERLVGVEAVLQHMPTKNSFHELAIAMKGLEGELGKAVVHIGGVTQDLTRIESTIRRHEDILSSAAREER